MSNFSFLSPPWSVLAELGELAERNLYIDPNTSLIKLRMFSEVMAKYLLAYEKIEEPDDVSAASPEDVKKRRETALAVIKKVMQRTVK